MEDGGMVCGGNVDIFLEPLFERHKELYDISPPWKRRGRRAIIVTRFGKDHFSKPSSMRTADIGETHVAAANSGIRTVLLRKSVQRSSGTV